MFPIVYNLYVFKGQHSNVPIHFWDSRCFMISMKGAEFILGLKKQKAVSWSVKDNNRFGFMYTYMMLYKGTEIVRLPSWLYENKQLYFSFRTCEQHERIRKTSWHECKQFVLWTSIFTTGIYDRHRATLYSLLDDKRSAWLISDDMLRDPHLPMPFLIVTAPSYQEFLVRKI